MPGKLLTICHSLILILILFVIARSSPITDQEQCSKYFDPFSCSIRKAKNCYIKAANEKDDCEKKVWKETPGITFTYDMIFKKKNLSCSGCCCHPIDSNGRKYYQNVCGNCVQLWSKPQKTRTRFKFTGNKSVMNEALKNTNFSKIHENGEFPATVIICPERRNIICRLESTNLNTTWTIVASDQNWAAYFEESIINGFMTVKNISFPKQIYLAIQRKLLNGTHIHFLNVINNAPKNKCLRCHEHKKLISTAPSSRTQTMVGSNTPTIHSKSFINTKISRIPEEEIITAAPLIISSTDTSNSSSNSLYRVEDKTLMPTVIYVQEKLKNELNSTVDESKRISVVAKFVGKYDHLDEDNLATAVEELDKVKKIQSNENITKEFTEVVDHVTSTNNVQSWKNLPQKTTQPSTIMKATDSYFKGATKHIKLTDKAREIQKDNLILHYGRISRRKAHIFNSYKVSFNAIINIPWRIIQTRVSKSIRYSFVYYKSLSVLMKTVAISWKETESQSERLNSPILSISLYPRLSYPLKENINFTLNHITKSNSRRFCAFWNFSYKSHRTGIYGRWETEGCHVVSQNETCTTCSCNHLTNFAILMSVKPTVANNDSVQTILSIISGTISVVAILLTILVYAILWPNITQNPVNRSRAIILMNMCVALSVANIIFLSGSRPIANKIACKLVSVSLHFFYLAVFFSMLMEGIDMLITVILVFSKKIKVIWFIIGTWFFPLLIVSISFPVKFHNYADANHCWLSISDGLRWAFIGPACFIIIVNTVILIIVLSKMLGTREMMQQTIRERVRCGIRGIVLLSPVLGFTWITGILLIHKNPVMEYLFIIGHAFQGIFIFGLHCIFSRQVRDGFRQWLHKKNYFTEFSNSTLKCAGLDQTNVTRTMSTAQSLDNLDSYQPKLSDFQPRKSCDYLIPGK